MRVVIPRNDVREPVAPMRGLKLEVATPDGRVYNGQRFNPPGYSAGTIIVAEDDVGLAEATAVLIEREFRREPKSSLTTSLALSADGRAG